VTAPPTSPWLVALRRHGAAPSRESRLRLLCFPYAGGGASAFRDWPDELPPEIEVWAVQPPGRETRLKEAPVRCLQTLVDALLEETRALRERPYAFFGHSLGALVAFELARALRRRGAAGPVHLLVSGCGAPQLSDPEPPLSELAPSDLKDRLRRLDGTPKAVLADREMMELLLPTLRADFGLRDDYVYTVEPAFEVPLTAFGGHDDPEVSAASLAAWRDQTRQRFVMRGFAGGHFFIRSARSALLAAVASELEHALAHIDPVTVRSPTARELRP
jgi:medium-chain acyl-[acyl-carrier-protein] hydrolase